jgi:ferrous iron transport protein A
MTTERTVTLASLLPGEAAEIVDVEGEGAFRRRLLDMGFTRGVLVSVIKHAPFRDPIEYCIGGTHVTLREQEARQVIVEPVAPRIPCRPHRRRKPLRRGLRHRRVWRKRRSP